MSDTKYLADLEDKLPDLEVVRLRQENAALRKQLEIAQEVLKENGLEEIVPTPMTVHERICHQQISKLAELSDKGLPFVIEDIKSLEILVKTLLAIQGKIIPAEDKKKSKKKTEVQVADLLAIVRDSKE